MLWSRTLLVLLGLAPAVVAIAAGCGGAVVSTDGDPTEAVAPPARPSKPPRGPSGTPARDAAVALPGACACTEQIAQVDGTCMYTIQPRLVECVAERSDDASSVTLDLFRSCISNPPPSWTPSVKATELELCSCVPGEKHSLCIRYR